MEIKPIEQILTTDGVHVVQIEIYNPHEVRQMEADFKEAIESLYLLAKVTPPVEVFPKTNNRVMDARKIIEKAYGESWDDIRREK